MIIQVSAKGPSSLGDACTLEATLPIAQGGMPYKNHFSFPARLASRMPLWVLKWERRNVLPAVSAGQRVTQSLVSGWQRLPSECWQLCNDWKSPVRDFLKPPLPSPFKGAITLFCQWVTYAHDMNFKNTGRGNAFKISKKPKKGLPTSPGPDDLGLLPRADPLCTFLHVLLEVFFVQSSRYASGSSFCPYPPTPRLHPQMVPVAVGSIEMDSEMEMGRAGASTVRKRRKQGWPEGGALTEMLSQQRLQLPGSSGAGMALWVGVWGGRHLISHCMWA